MVDGDRRSPLEVDQGRGGRPGGARNDCLRLSDGQREAGCRMHVSLVYDKGETSPVVTLGRQGCMRTEFCRFTGRPSPQGRIRSVKSIDR